ncbi:MAG: hypothetical protein A3K22_02120 [Deltaproteobacteria bacterium RBG_16_42_7]|nr:MAG: hypothetical protein A3K22_02120 [Deltaproteobacteria bacterium RBG_16_42_7]
MAGNYKHTIVNIDLFKVIQDFQDFARQTTPDFSYIDAVRKKIWSSNISRKLKLTFNAIKKMAGLPVRMERKGDGKSKIAKQQKYELAKPKKREVPPTKPCLGILPNDKHCQKYVPQGQYFCPRCRDRKNSL